MNFLKHAKRIPALDLNTNFFGAHEQHVTKGWIVPPEAHYAFECIYVLSGEEFIKMNDHTYALHGGDLFIVPPEFIHQVWSGLELKYFCFHFDFDDVSLKTQLIKDLQHFYSKDSLLVSALSPHLLTLDHLSNLIEFNFITKMNIQIELSHILQNLYQATVKNKRNSPDNHPEYARLIADELKLRLNDQVLTFVKNGISGHEKSVDVNSAISKIGISDGYGFRVFKDTFGISPRNYLTKLKVSEAKKLLGKQQYAIADIATALGYGNVSNFSRQFKRWTTITPSKFRKIGNHPKW